MMSGHTDRWSLAEQGECFHCGAHELVFREPFSGEDACRPCWELICYGEGEE